MIAELKLNQFCRVQQLPVLMLRREGERKSKSSRSFIFCNASVVIIFLHFIYCQAEQ